MAGRHVTVSLTFPSDPNRVENWGGFDQSPVRAAVLTVFENDLESEALRGVIEARNDVGVPSSASKGVPALPEAAPVLISSPPRDPGASPHIPLADALYLPIIAEEAMSPTRPLVADPAPVRAVSIRVGFEAPFSEQSPRQLLVLRRSASGSSSSLPLGSPSHHSAAFSPRLRSCDSAASDDPPAVQPPTAGGLLTTFLASSRLSAFSSHDSLATSTAAPPVDLQLAATDAAPLPSPRSETPEAAAAAGAAVSSDDLGAPAPSLGPFAAEVAALAVLRSPTAGAAVAAASNDTSTPRRRARVWVSPACSAARPATAPVFTPASPPIIAASTAAAAAQIFTPASPPQSVAASTAAAATQVFPRASPPPRAAAAVEAAVTLIASSLPDAVDVGTATAGLPAQTPAAVANETGARDGSPVLAPPSASKSLRTPGVSKPLGPKTPHSHRQASSTPGSVPLRVTNRVTAPPSSVGKKVGSPTATTAAISSPTPNHSASVAAAASVPATRAAIASKPRKVGMLKLAAHVLGPKRVAAPPLPVALLPHATQSPTRVSECTTNAMPPEQSISAISAPTDTPASVPMPQPAEPASSSSPAAQVDKEGIPPVSLQSSNDVAYSGVGVAISAAASTDQIISGTNLTDTACAHDEPEAATNLTDTTRQATVPSVINMSPLMAGARVGAAEENARPTPPAIPATASAPAASGPPELPRSLAGLAARFSRHELAPKRPVMRVPAAPTAAAPEVNAAAPPPVSRVGTVASGGMSKLRALAAKSVASFTSKLPRSVVAPPGEHVAPDASGSAPDDADSALKTTKALPSLSQPVRIAAAPVSAPVAAGGMSLAAKPSATVPLPFKFSTAERASRHHSTAAVASTVEDHARALVRALRVEPSGLTRHTLSFASPLLQDSALPLAGTNGTNLGSSPPTRKARRIPATAVDAMADGDGLRPAQQQPSRAASAGAAPGRLHKSRMLTMQRTQQQAPAIGAGDAGAEAQAGPATVGSTPPKKAAGRHSVDGIAICGTSSETAAVSSPVGSTSTAAQAAPHAAPPMTPVLAAEERVRQREALDAARAARQHEAAVAAAAVAEARRIAEESALRQLRVAREFRARPLDPRVLDAPAAARAPRPHSKPATVARSPSLATKARSRRASSASAGPPPEVAAVATANPSTGPQAAPVRAVAPALQPAPSRTGQVETPAPATQEADPAAQEADPASAAPAKPALAAPTQVVASGSVAARRGNTGLVDRKPNIPTVAAAAGSKHQLSQRPRLAAAPAGPAAVPVPA